MDTRKTNTQSGTIPYRKELQIPCGSIWKLRDVSGTVSRAAISPVPDLKNPKPPLINRVAAAKLKVASALDAEKECFYEKNIVLAVIATAAMALSLVGCGVKVTNISVPDAATLERVRASRCR